MDESSLSLDGQVWTAEGDKVFHRGRVRVENGQIAAVGRKEDVGVAREGTHLDFADQWIIPGLIDAHTHLMFGGQGYSGYDDYIRELRSQSNGEDMALLRAVKNAQIHQAVGVTTLRDSGAVDAISLSLKEGISRGYVSGPRVLACGRPITITGGHFWWCNQEADGADGVRRAVRQLHRDKADFIKIMASGGGTAGTDPRRPSFTLREMQALVQEAHARGLKCSAHCEATGSVRRAVQAGVDTIEHAGFQEPDGTRTYCPELVEMMVEKGLSYCPTIQTAYRALSRYRRAGGSEERIRAARYKLRRKLENLSRMLEAGVTVAAGTDAIRTFGDYVVGLELFVHAGMSPQQALLSATSTAASVLGVDEITGSIRQGKSADLLVVGGNPLSDIANLRQVKMVIQKGTRVTPAPHVEAALPDEAAAGHRSDIGRVLGVQ